MFARWQQLVAPLFGDALKLSPRAHSSASLAAFARDGDDDDLTRFRFDAAALQAGSHRGWRCIPCKLTFSSAAALGAHTQEHVSCLVAHCSFSASKEIVLSHIVDTHADLAARVEPARAQWSLIGPMYDGIDSSLDDSGLSLWHCEPCEQRFSDEPEWRVHVTQHAELAIATVTAAVVDEESVVCRPSRSRMFYDSFEPQEQKTCKFCYETGHWTRECPVRPMNLVPPPGYRCKLCNVPGHWHCDCPMNVSVADGREKRGASFTLASNASSTSNGDDAKLSTQPTASSSKSCKFCFEVGHWTSDCPKRDVTKLPPDGYCCKICHTVGHWIYDCPRMVGATATRAAWSPPAQSKPPTRYSQAQSDSHGLGSASATTGAAANGSASSTYSVPPVRTYCCVACGIPGHSIFKCPMKLKRVDLVEAQHHAVQLELQAHQTDPSSPPTSPTSVAMDAESELAATRLSKLKASLQPWRCEPCDKNFAVKSQLAAHSARHMLCSAPGCEFSAAKRVVTVHAKVVHG